VIDERQQGMEPEPFLVGGLRVFLLTVGGDQGGIDINDQPSSSITVMVRCLVAGQFPHAGTGSRPSGVDRCQGLVGVGGERADQASDRRVRGHWAIQVGFIAEDGTIGQGITAEARVSAASVRTLPGSLMVEAFVHAAKACLNWWPRPLVCTVSVSSIPPAWPTALLGQSRRASVDRYE